MSTPDPGAPRVVRVFISSTFRDMQAERDELVKRVFPQVRRVCEQRGVTWGEVDLRWGVTDEQKAEGDVLPICLAEIERTRPYFIGLLGQRYGWVPDDLPADLPPDWTWLRDAHGRSVTELEILHGVLNDPEAAGHALFYLRDPAWVEAQPAADRAVYLEETAVGREKLAGLRDRVLRSGHPAREYADPVDLGRAVLADLLALVDRLYPEAEVPDALDRDRAAHAAVAASRTAGFVPRPDLAAGLDDAAATGAAVLVTGPSGSGATALVADWARRHRAAHPDDVVVEHYVAASASAADWSGLVTRLAAELARGLGRPDLALDPPPADPVALRAAFAAALSRAAAAGRRIVLVVDGVDDLDDVDGAPDLLWLPAHLPTGVTAVVTGTGPRPLQMAVHRGWRTIDVPPLDEDERRAFIASFLGRYSKGLDDQPTTRLATAEQTGSPAYLRTVLDELRQHGDHFTLPELIERLLAAATVDDLLEQVLARYERDFERDRPGLVRDAFTALWAARRGVGEAELLDLLGGGDPLPMAVWSPLGLAAEQLLANRSGLLAPASADVRRAIADRYLPRDVDRADAHGRLAAYFAGRPMGDRVVDELPWQQWSAGDLGGLVTTLSDDAFVERAYVTALPDLRRLWALAESAGASMAGAYAPIVADPATHESAGARGQLVWGVARLLGDAGHTAEALRLQRHLVATARLDPAGAGEAPGGDARLRAALVNLGSALWARGDHAAAEPVLIEAVQRCRAAGDDAMLSAALGNLAMVTREMGDLEAADALAAEEGRLCRSSGDAYALQAHLGNRAQLLRQQGRYDEALDLLREQESISRDLADGAGIARALGGQAAVLADRGAVDDALALVAQQLAAVQEVGDARGLVEARLNEAVMRSTLGDSAGAVTAAAQAEEVARRLGDDGLLARVLVARSLAVSSTGDWATAERVAREAELTGRAAGTLPQVALALGVIGTARREQGDLGGCRATHEEELRVAQTTGDPQAVASAQANLGTCDLAENRLAGALARYAEAEPTFRRLQVHTSLLPMLANRAQIHDLQQQYALAAADYADAAASAAVLGNAAAARQWGERGVQLAYQVGDVTRAESLWASLAAAYRATGDDAALQRALGERALLLINRSQPVGVAGTPETVDQGLLDQAGLLLDEQEAICRRTGDQAGLGACVGNRAIVLRYRGDLAGSLACLDEQLALASATGNGQAWLIAMANRGEVLGLLGRVDEALAALQQARDTAARYGPQLQPMVQQLDQMIAALRAGQPGG